MHKYETIIYWSDEDQAFLAEVPELPGCIAHGDSPADALANAMQAIELWIATAEEFGNSVPQPKGARLVDAQAESRKINRKTKMTESELAAELKRMYDNAPHGESTAMIRLFGIKYAGELKNSGVPIARIAEKSVGYAYHAEISKGIRLAKYVKLKEGVDHV